MPACKVTRIVEGTRISVILGNSDARGELHECAVWEGRHFLGGSKGDSGSCPWPDLDGEAASALADGQRFDNAAGHDERLAGFSIYLGRRTGPVVLRDSGADDEKTT
jgi:hypothetical protein